MHRQGSIRPTYDQCKYCKKIVFSGTDFRCKGPCRKLIHYGCAMKVYRDHMTTYFGHDNIYCFSCSIDKHNLFQINASSKNFKNFKDSMRPPKTNTSTYFTLPTKMDVKNQIDTPGPSGISNMNLPKANISKNSKNFKDSMRPPNINISTYSTSPTKMDVKNQIDTPGPSGNSNVNPKANISTCSISPTKKSLNVENQMEPLSPYENPNLNSSKIIFTYYVSPTKTSSVTKNLQFRTIIHNEEEHFDIQKPIIEVENDKKLIEYQQISANQTKMMAQMTNDFNSLKFQRTEMEKQVQNIKKLQLDTLKEIKAQYQMINNHLNEVQKEVKEIKDQVSCSKTEKVEEFI